MEKHHSYRIVQFDDAIEDAVHFADVYVDLSVGQIWLNDALGQQEYVLGFEQLSPQVRGRRLLAYRVYFHPFYVESRQQYAVAIRELRGVIEDLVARQKEG